MARVTRETAQRGEIFAVERIDYRVTCAGLECCCEALISWDNQCTTIGRARQRAKHDALLVRGVQIQDWEEIGGIWYCEKCKHNQRKAKT